MCIWEMAGEISHKGCFIYHPNAEMNIQNLVKYND